MPGGPGTAALVQPVPTDGVRRKPELKSQGLHGPGQGGGPGWIPVFASLLLLFLPRSKMQPWEPAHADCAWEDPDLHHHGTVQSPDSWAQGGCCSSQTLLQRLRPRVLEAQTWVCGREVEGRARLCQRGSPPGCCSALEGPPHFSLGHRRGGRPCTQITGRPAIWCKMLPLKSNTLKSNLAKSLHHCF